VFAEWRRRLDQDTTVGAHGNEPDHWPCGATLIGSAGSIVAFREALFVARLMIVVRTHQ
jgi:hypothetical protein